MNKLLFSFVISFLYMNHVDAQKQIKLTNQANHKIKFLKEGDRVAYTLHNRPTKAKRGIIKTIDNNFFVIDDKTVSYKDLIRISRGRKGTGFLQATCILLGGASVVDSFRQKTSTSTSSCTNCQTDDSISIEGIVVGVGLIGLGVYIGTSSGSVDVIKEWKLEVTE